MQPGTQLGSYEILSPLGKGGMGEVWRARDSKLGREVAIKTLPEAFAEDEERLARFEREAKLLASLNHPNIAAIYGLEEDNGTRFLVLELVEGDTLAERLKRGAIPVEETLKLALQIAEALEAAHGKGVIHRDLKPANINVTPDRKIKVLDFGLAKAFAGDGSDVNLSQSPTLSMAATQPGVILGTAAYMSPEQARGQEVDKTADVWAFGCVLFEMLAGRRTYEGPTVSDVLAGVLAREPAWKSLPPNLHPRIRLLLERCLEKDSKDRYRGIEDARVDVQKVLADPASVLVQFAEGVQPQPTLRVVLPWVVAGIALSAIVAGLAGWNLKPSEPRPISRFYHVLPENQQFTNIGRPVVALSPDGSKMVYVANQQLYLKPMDTLESSPIPGTNENPAVPFFSPDGEWIGYFSRADGQLKKIAVGGGTPVMLSDAGYPYGLPFWGADDTIVWGRLAGIMRVSANGGTPERLIAGDGELLGHPQILSDGEAVLLHVGSAGVAEIAVHTLESGERKVLFAGTHPRYVPTGHLVYELDSVLFAVPFDIDSLQVTGGPVALVEGIRRGPVHFALSDTGSLIYVPGTAADTELPNGVLTWVDRNGEREALPVPPRPYLHPRLSPDGNRLAVQTTSARGVSGLWIYDLVGNTQIQQLAGAGNNFRPIWTPDGERLTFTSDRGGTDSIWWQPADGSRPAEPLTQAEEGLSHWPDSWSPDGRTLAFTKVLAGSINGVVTSMNDQQVWTLSLDDGAEPEFVAGHRRPGEPHARGIDFSPDGRWIAYRSTEGGAHIQLQPFPTTGARYDTAQEGGSDPMWSRDGSQLFYWRDVAPAVGREGPSIDGRRRFN